MEDFQSHSAIQKMGDWGGVVKYGNDASLIAMFYMHPVHNPAKSVAMGSPQYEDVIYVRIHPPGERLNIIDRPATVQDKQRFDMQWRQFQDNAPQTASGTPVDLLFPAKPSIAAALKASGVFTVESLAKLSAHAIEQIGMGCQQWVNDAVRYLEVANKGVKASQLKAIVEEKDREITSLKHKVDLLETELGNIRDRAMSSVTMAQVQQLIANQGGRGGNRAVYPPGRQQPFDVQSEQIAATHTTRDLAKSRSKEKLPVKQRRERARIG